MYSLALKHIFYDQMQTLIKGNHSDGMDSLILGDVLSIYNINNRIY